MSVITDIPYLTTYLIKDMQHITYVSHLTVQNSKSFYLIEAK